MKTILSLVTVLVLVGCSRNETENQSDTTKPLAGDQTTAMTNSTSMNTMANNPNQAITNRMDTNNPAITNPPPMQP